MHRIAVFASAAILLSAGGVSAQIGDVGGTVVHVDTGANTVTFSDGRIVHYDPQWRILVNGREVAISEDQPGAVIAMASPGTPVRAVVAGSPQPAMAQVQVPPGSTDSTAPSPAVVATIDKTTGTITLEDGRVVKLSEVQVWRQEMLEDLRPGSQVYVGPLPPAAGRPATIITTPPTASTTTRPAWTATDREMRGRVTRVNPHGSQIILNDGRTVIVSPSTTVRTVKAQTVTVNELRPGDEVVIQVQQIIPVAGLDVTTPEGRHVTADGHHVASDGRHVMADGRRVTSDGRYITADGRYATTSGSMEERFTSPSYRYPGSAKVAPDRVLIIRYPQAL